MSSSLLSELPIVAAAVATPLAMNWLLRLSRKQKARARGDLLIFPVSIASRALGLAVTVGSAIAEYFSLTTFATSRDLWMIFFFVGTGAIGIWMSFGEFKVNSSYIEKRVLWFKKSLPWNQVEEIDETSGGSTLYGTNTNLWIEPFYADYGRLLQEIHSRAPHLKVREKSKWKKRLGW